MPLSQLKTYNSASNMPDILPVKPAVTDSGIASVKLN